MMAWALFVNPMPLTASAAFWLLLPLCVAVATVYRTVRIQHTQRLLVAILKLLGYIVVGMAIISVILWLIGTYWP